MVVAFYFFAWFVVTGSSSQFLNRNKENTKLRIVGFFKYKRRGRVLIYLLYFLLFTLTSF